MRDKYGFGADGFDFDGFDLKHYQQMGLRLKDLDQSADGSGYDAFGRLIPSVYEDDDLDQEDYELDLAEREKEIQDEIQWDKMVLVRIDEGALELGILPGNFTTKKGKENE